MTARGSTAVGLLVGLGLILALGTAVVAMVVVLRRARAEAEVTPRDVVVAPLAPPSDPIGSEAGVFRTRPSMLAIGDPAAPRRAANPRTLHQYRTRRAYPGAPPQIPHGLTAIEYRTGACNTCHQRGGYSPRFGAYVPVTPHPEMGACLQCHVGIDEITAVALPDQDPNTICRQCHDPNAPRANPTADWGTMAWPRLVASPPGGPPPPILHDLQMRTNCLACHAGPAAVPELRTAHPERANCRQCHLTADAAAEPFARPAAGGGSARGSE